MGQTVSEETKEKKAWDSNAITPGTPFMDLLASSLRYWVTRKINTDPGWKDVSLLASCSYVSITYDNSLNVAASYTFGCQCTW